MRALHWFRNDLRLRDNTALAAAAGRSEWLVPVFVLDPVLLARSRPRARFLIDCLERLAADLERRNSGLVVLNGRAEVELPKLSKRLGATHVFSNRDTSPYSRRRDHAVRIALEAGGVESVSVKDRVIFEAEEVRTNGGQPYAVYTPYRNRWWQQLRAEPPFEAKPLRLPPLPAGVPRRSLPKPLATDVAGPCGGEAAAIRRLDHFVENALGDYATMRDIPSVDGTSRLSPHLRFGTISVRRCVRVALSAAAAEPRCEVGAKKWVDELVWRDFYSGILQENPHVLQGAHRSEYDALEWDDAPDRFEAWCRGETGFPFVDAAMRQLNQTGWMHNRARMVVASFLTKDLGIDWRKGERYFDAQLIDFDPASNNGGWQWSASTGSDAQPYFRIFNPVSQSARFDPSGLYIRSFVEELAGTTGQDTHEPWRSPLSAPGYPPRIVDHAERRQIALARYKAVRDSVRAVDPAAVR